jgi:hypothetical protein
MKIKEFFMMLGMVSILMGCNINSSQSKSARANGYSPGDHSPQKPDPTPAKIVEKIKALQFQRPTQEETEFLNIMDLDLTAGDRALFSFSYAPDKDGTFYFSLAQTRLHLQGCTKSGNRKYKLRIFWQQVQAEKRVVLKEFKPNIDSFAFKAGGQYLLSYALMDLKEFSDCQVATLKFASFLQDYKEVK